MGHPLAMVEGTVEPVVVDIVTEVEEGLEEEERGECCVTIGKCDIYTGYKKLI